MKQVMDKWSAKRGELPFKIKQEVMWQNLIAVWHTQLLCEVHTNRANYNPRYKRFIALLFKLWYLSPGSNSARLWPWTTSSRSTTRWAMCSIFCSTKTSPCPSVTAPILVSTRPSVMYWPYLCPHPNISRASASWTKWKAILVCDFIRMWHSMARP